MKSTGEVMGLDVTFGTAFYKSQVASFGPLPTKGTVFVSVANRDKRFVIFPVKRLADLGFEILATVGTESLVTPNGFTNRRSPHWRAWVVSRRPGARPEAGGPGIVSPSRSRGSNFGAWSGWPPGWTRTGARSQRGRVSASDTSNWARSPPGPS